MGCFAFTDKIDSPQHWPPGLVSRQRLFRFREALIYLSYPGVRAHGQYFEEQKLVVRAGNAPASSGYQPGALLLSYGTIFTGGGPESANFKVKAVATVQIATALQKVAAQVGIAPTQSG